MFSGSVFIYFFLFFSRRFSSFLLLFFFCILLGLNCIAVCDLKAYKIPLDFWVPADRAMIAYSMDFCDAAPALDYEWGFVQKHTFYFLFFRIRLFFSLTLSFLFTPVFDSPFFSLFLIRPISLPFIQFRFLSIFSHSLEIGLFLFFASLGYFNVIYSKHEQTFCDCDNFSRFLLPFAMRKNCMHTNNVGSFGRGSG